MNIIYPIAFVTLSLAIMATIALFPIFFNRRDLDEANDQEEDEQ
jgi:hypothetical protein